jgi:anti-sigma regulatory factor (Ser/Thr protein kinase)
MVALRQPGHQRFTISDEADPGALRRAVSAYADRAGASPKGRWRGELVATELATNLVRHAKPGGWVLMRPVPPGRIELIAVDQGPGIADVAAVLDGGSTPPHPLGQGLGKGLAAVRRASCGFDVYSQPGRGTTVLAVVDLTDDEQPVTRSWAGVSIGIIEPCGDGWTVAELDDGLAVAVIDGLGHGRHASAATDAALVAFATRPDDVDGFVRRANEAMRGTRGGAAAVCRLWPERGLMKYTIVGNVSGRVVSAGPERGLVSSSGTLGLQVTPPKTAVLECAFPADAMLVLWTDGLTSRFDLATRPELRYSEPAVVAATLHRDHSRERDDATVVVVRARDVS